MLRTQFFDSANVTETWYKLSLYFEPYEPRIASQLSHVSLPGISLVANLHIFYLMFIHLFSPFFSFHSS